MTRTTYGRVRQILAMTVPVLLLVLGSVRAEGLGPVVVRAGADGSLLYVCEAEAKQVAVVQTADGAIARTLPLPGTPGDLVMSPDGGRLFVAVAEPEGKLLALDAASGKVTMTVAVGHTPCGLSVSPDGGTVYVCNRFDTTVSVVDVKGGRQTAAIPVRREPVSSALTPDGALLLVANHLPTGVASGAYIAAGVSLIDTATGAVVKDIVLPNGSTGLRAICLSPDGAFAYVTHILGRYQVPTTQLERGWMNTNALTVIDCAKREAVNTVLLDDVDLGAANPWGVSCTPDGVSVCVTHAGTHELSVLNREKLHQRLADAAAGKKVTSVSSSADMVPNDLSFRVDVRQRYRLTGNGTRSVVVVGKTAYVTEYFSDTLCKVDLEAPRRRAATTMALGPKTPMSTVRRGEMLFNDAALCFQHWQSCASCHPDVRADGLNWDLLNDGMGNPKQTKSLLYSHRTAPVMVTGIRPDAETAVRAGIRYIQFAVRPDEDAVALDAFLKQLEPVPSPHLVDGELSKSAERGRKVFSEAGCARCHPAPLYTDKNKYVLGLGDGPDNDAAFDTSTLIENWRTAPFLYDGRAATMVDVVQSMNPGDKHGKTSGLSDREREDLVEFLLSL